MFTMPCGMKSDLGRTFCFRLFHTGSFGIILRGCASEALPNGSQRHFVNGSLIDNVPYWVSGRTSFIKGGGKTREVSSNCAVCLSLSCVIRLLLLGGRGAMEAELRS